VLKPDPSRFKGDSRPVEQVSWNEAVEFCARLSAHTGRQYRLPTEAEWEYACRAGTTTPFYFGETISSDLANYDATITYGDGQEGGYQKQTTDVGCFPLSAFGLHDMHGNVWEWCQDHWHSNYEGAPTDGSAWLSNDESEYRILRGGSWFFYPRFCRSAYRFFNFPDFRYKNIGFRVVCAEFNHEHKIKIQLFFKNVEKPLITTILHNSPNFSEQDAYQLIQDWKATQGNDPFLVITDQESGLPDAFDVRELRAIRIC
jgi:hypothetical protein